jgi:soluble lytic murein transglycosylase-like protein
MARIVVKHSERYKVPVNLVLSVMTVESHFVPTAVSNVGAQGLMQVMPSTAAEIAKELRASAYDPFELDWGIRAGTYYLRKMLKTFNGDIDLAVKAYNAGAANTSKSISPPETVDYHKSVMGLYNWLESKDI